MSYALDLYDLAGSSIAVAAPTGQVTARWDLDGPGSLEVALKPSEIGSPVVWLPGRRRVVLRSGSTPIWGGYLVGLDLSLEAQRVPRYTARCLGHAHGLAGRVVLGDFSRTSTPTTTIAWDLIQHAQGQPDGNLGITLGTITGTAPSRTRHYCDTDGILEAIDELASRKPGGFDWEISADRKFNAWVGGRGTDKSATVSFGAADVSAMEVSWEGSDLVTYAHALGQDPEGPCGPSLVTRSSALAGTYIRQDAVVQVDTSDVTELTEAADHELDIRSSARLRVSVRVHEGVDPKNLLSLELGDRVTANLPDAFDGSVVVRLITRQLTLDPPALATWELGFER